jgi:hypothetical protein
MSKKIKLHLRFMVACLYLICVFSLAQARVFAEEKTAIFYKDAVYNIYYEVSKFEVDFVSNVKILGIRTIDGVTFLFIKGSSL